MEHEDLLAKGFQLAHFIYPDRATAIQVLSTAFNRLNAQHGCERKRSYWRDKHLKRRIYRISKNQADILQWLIYFESEHFERQQECLGLQTQEDMVVRYIKFLLQITTARSSFYVCVGVQRLLHHYSTAETQRSYEFLSDRYPGSDEYRRAKGALMGRIQTRFCEFLKFAKADNGEVTFDSTDDSSRWTNLVRECLVAFTPWTTVDNCLIPNGFHHQSQDLPNLLSGVGHQKQDQDEIELNRCHCFIDPVCHRRLLSALGLDAPEKRLTLPRFFTNKTGKSEPDLPRRASGPGLTDAERSTIKNNLAADIRRRDRVSPATVRILVDDNEVMHGSVNLGSDVAFEIAEGARLIEILTSDEQGEFVVATQIIPLRHWRDSALTEAMIPLRNSKLAFTFMPAKFGTDGAHVSQVSLRFLPTIRGFRFLTDRLADHPRSLIRLKYALVGFLCICLGWMANTVRHRSQIARVQNQVADLSNKLARERVGRERKSTWKQLSSFRLASDELRPRSGTGAEVPVLKINSDQVVVRLILPVSITARQYRVALKPLLKERPLISEDIPQPNQTSAGPAIVFDVPTSLLKNTQDYTVVLSSIDRSTVNEIDSFTFRVIESND